MNQLTAIIIFLFIPVQYLSVDQTCGNEMLTQIKQDLGTNLMPRCWVKLSKFFI